MTHSDVNLVTHAPDDCPGLNCPGAWHTGGCGPMWTYMDADGYDISGNLYAEQDAHERHLWLGPDAPDRVELRRGDGWEVV